MVSLFQYISADKQMYCMYKGGFALLIWNTSKKQAVLHLFFLRAHTAAFFKGSVLDSLFPTPSEGKYLIHVTFNIEFAWIPLEYQSTPSSLTTNTFTLIFPQKPQMKYSAVNY